MKISKDKTDKLFSDKLEGYSKTPREQAWLKLEAKLQNKQNKVVPIWQRLVFAASITLLVFAGILAYIYQPANTLNVDQVADNQISKKLIPRLTLKSIDAEVTVLAGSNSQEKAIKNAFNRSRQNAGIFQTATERSIPVKENSEEQTSNFETSQAKEIENENVAQLLDSQPVENKGFEGKTHPSEDLTVVVTLANFEPPNKSVPYENQEIEKKTKFVSRLFKQLINAKNGDKVEWNEIGLKPAKILARAEGRLKSTSDGFNNSYQSTKNKTIL